jgi:type III secretion protein J
MAGCNEQIVHDLSERDANRIVSHLSASHLEADKVPQADGRWAISVARADMVPALRHLDAQRLLISRDSGALSSARGSIVPSREEQWFRYERSVSLSIEESIKALPGVLDARVHVTIPDQDPLFGSRESKKGSGSVLVVVDDRFRSNEDEIAALVGGAAGLSRDVVRVLRSSPESVSGPPVSRQYPSSGDSSSLLLEALSWWPHVIGSLALLGSLMLGFAFVRRTKAPRVFPLPARLDFEG